MEYKILVAESDYYTIVKLESMVIKCVIEHRRNTATLSTTTIKTNSSTQINLVESFVKFLPSTTIKWDASDGYYLCYQSDSLLMWVILEDQNEKYYRDMYEEQKRHVEIYKKNTITFKQNLLTHQQRIIILQDKLDANTGTIVSCKKECERLIKEMALIKIERDKTLSELLSYQTISAKNQIEYNRLAKELSACQMEKTELTEELNIYITNEDIYKQNLERRQAKIIKLQKKVNELTNQ